MNPLGPTQSLSDAARGKGAFGERRPRGSCGPQRVHGRTPGRCSAQYQRPGRPARRLTL